MDAAWNNKCSALSNLDKYQEAIECCDIALSINPNFDAAWNNKCSALKKLKRYQETIVQTFSQIALNITISILNSQLRFIQSTTAIPQFLLSQNNIKMQSYVLKKHFLFLMTPLDQNFQLIDYSNQGFQMKLKNHQEYIKTQLQSYE
ncbi:unnamed protein product [Paramecium octaurelia]|uniref:Tetratricopeptide repeat protein n=1 Tax=Paramecium octaurelia TaxID=43137 RepID=A0A8S1YM42_PAROT|nr:unnamed protein product [Paramecium octaurelia]